MSEASVDDIVRAASQMQVVRGAPDDVEVAALVAGLAAVASHALDDGSTPSHAAASQWPRSLRRSGALSRVGSSQDSWRWSLRA